MNPSRPARSPWWLWAVAGVLVAFSLTRLFRADRHTDQRERREARPTSSASERRQLADAVYLRFLQDEGARSPLEKFQRAVGGVARAHKMDPAALEAELKVFATQLESNSAANEYETTLAAMIRGEFKPAGAEPRVESAAPEPYRLPADPLTGTLPKIQMLTFAGDFAEAERMLDSTQRLASRGRQPEEWARLQAARYILRWRQGRFDEALRLAQDVLETRERCLPPTSPGLANALYNLGVSLSQDQRPSDAIPLFTRALAIYEKAYGPDDVEVGDTASELADALADAERLQEAEAAARRAISILKAAGHESALRLALAYDRLGVTLLSEQRASEAEPVLRSAVAIYDGHADARAKDHSDAVHRLGLSIARQGRRREALPQLRRSTEIAAKWYAPDDPLYAVLFHNLAVWSDAAGDDPGTVAAYEKALQILAANRRRTKREPTQLSKSCEFYEAYLKRAGLSASEIQRRVSAALR